MTGSSLGFGLAIHLDAVGGYEALRLEVLENKTGSSTGLGLLLLMREGMMAWAAAWSQSVSSLKGESFASPDLPAISQGFGAEVSTLIAQMVIGLMQKEEQG